jgi:AhpD family alkylhydroperoxidase
MIMNIGEAVMAEEKSKGIIGKAKDKISELGKTKDKLSLLLKTKSLMGDEKLTETLVELVEKNYGNLGFLMKTLKERPRTFNPFIFKGMSTYKEPSTISRKTAELAAVSASAALRCEHCLEAHIRRAVDEGATLEEVMDVILVAGSISESSTLSVAFRKYKQQEAKIRKKGS